MIKQMTLMRQKGFDEIRKGDAASVARGTKFLLRYSLFVGSAGAGANFIIQSLLGRDRELEWGDIPLNALKNFGMSQYTMDKVAEGKLGEAAASVLSPPALVLFEIASLILSSRDSPGFISHLSNQTLTPLCIKESASPFAEALSFDE